MALIRVCDQCGKQGNAHPQNGVDQPPDWFNLRRLDFKGQVQLCSLDCVIAHTEALRIGEQKELEHART